jgi:NitT/TauT family transport system substrate-binding protein
VIDFPKLTREVKVKTIRSSAVSWLWAPVDVAVKQGYFKDEGIENENFSLGQGDNNPALISGAADFLLGAPTSPMKAVAQGQDVIVVAGLVNKYASNVVVKKEFLQRAGITRTSTFQQRANVLRGLRIGTTGPAAAPDLLIRYICSKAGIDPERDLTLVPLQGAATGMLAAIEKGQIDGFCLSSPTSDQSNLYFGTDYLFNMVEDPVPGIETILYICVAAMKSYIERNPDIVAAYVRALQRALNFIKTDKEGFKAIMAELFKDSDPRVVELGFAGNYPIYSRNTIPTRDDFTKNLEFLRISLSTTGGNVADLDRLSYEKVMDPRFGEAALRAVGQS